MDVANEAAKGFVGALGLVVIYGIVLALQWLWAQATNKWGPSRTTEIRRDNTNAANQKPLYGGGQALEAARSHGTAVPRMAGDVSRARAESHTASASAPSSNHDEHLWAGALLEFEGPDRRQGLWAKSFAQAGGDEHAAKAAYIKARVAEYIEEAREAELATQRHRQALEDAQRLGSSQRLAAIRALDEKGVCPNCQLVIVKARAECMFCGAIFGHDSAWAPGPLPALKPDQAIQVLTSNGYAVTGDGASGWAVLGGSQDPVHAFSTADLHGLSQLAERKLALARWTEDIESKGQPASTTTGITHHV